MVYMHTDTFCESLGLNSVPIITITAKKSKIPVQKRDFVVFCARVHPGECNSSWIMHGILHNILE